MNTTLGIFTDSAIGQTPESGFASATIMGREGVNPQATAVHIGNAVLKGSAHPTTWLMATEEIAPGGRPRNEIDPALLKGKKHFTAKDDMFGAPAVPAPGAKA